jgi:hypothetical protein
LTSGVAGKFYFALARENRGTFQALYLASDRVIIGGRVERQ